jgi:polysaccharide export outer membrane protein
VYRYTPELNETVTVEPDGFINLDPTGEIKVAGLTLTQATDLITQSASKRLHDPKITLTLKEFHKPYYVVAGEVTHPGRFDMDEPTTALQAILMAGGMDTAARSSQVIVFRRINQEDDEVHVLNLHKVNKVQDLEHDLMLEPGDMLLVPKDRIAKMDRIIKATNVGLYFSPTQF